MLAAVVIVVVVDNPVAVDENAGVEGGIGVGTGEFCTAGSVIGGPGHPSPRPSSREL